MFDLKAVLPAILPRAIVWAEAQERHILNSGISLNAQLSGVALGVGVRHPEKVFLLEVENLPLPVDPDLRQAALETNLLGPRTVGLALGYGIYLRKGYGTVRLISHELRHVHQYEEAGSIAAFLPIYLVQIADVGYENSPYEIDARRHEKRDE
jgi:hypothetical protein